MAQIPEIKIPAELLPVDGRFGAGPSKIRSEQIQALVDKSLTGGVIEADTDPLEAAAVNQGKAIIGDSPVPRYIQATPNVSGSEPYVPRLVRNYLRFHSALV